MPENDDPPPPSSLAPADDPRGITIPISSTSTPVPSSPPPSSRPTSSHYVPELPLPEELQEMLGSGYVVESFLGQGGMGAVYKGLQMPLRRPMAIKILARRGQGVEDDFAFEERFKREAYAMAALTHPHIVQVYDCGDAGDNYLFISMELLEGGDLSDAIKAGKCTPEVALKLIPQICDALQAAHERGIVHRDIKPANIFLTADGRAKVADFGLAKKFDAQSTFATKTGMSMGTPDYASPEQFDAVADLDHRADVYSLGVMMYQMFTGTLPRGSFRPASKRVAIDPRIDDVLVKAMEHDRADRYQSVAEIKADLAAITQQAPSPQTAVRRPASPSPTVAARTSTTRSASSAVPHATRAAAPRAAAPPPRRKKSSGALIGTVVAAVALLGAGAWIMLKGPAVTPVPRGPFTNSLGMKFVPVPGTDIAMCIHETRRRDYAAYAADVPGVDETWKSPMIGNKVLSQGDDHPVIQVNWHDANAFCAWLSKKEGLTYRLPTQREWDLAVVTGVDDPESITPAALAAKLTNQFQWGTDKESDAPQYGNYLNSDAFPGTAPVMSFKPNHLGIYDLGGNAWEWEADLFKPDDANMRVLRGCGFLNFGPYRRSKLREGAAAELRAAPEGDNVRRIPGFRIVAVVGRQAADRPIAEDNNATANPASAPGALLFDGKTLNGWEPRPANSFQNWRTEEGYTLFKNIRLQEQP